MKKTVLKLASPTIIQLEAGEQSAIRDGGDLYIRIQTEEGIEASDEEPAKKLAPKAEEVASPAPVASAPATAQATTATEKLTEKQMQAMATSDLLDICEEMGIDPSQYEGQNTNKKLRLLILDAYESEGEDKPAPARASRAEAVAEVVDDTASPARPARPTRGAPAGEPVDVLITDWDSLKAGDMVLAKLKTDNEADSAKLWEAQVVGWDTPKGVKEEKLFVFFLEDDTEDFLREEDELYVFRKQI